MFLIQDNNVERALDWIFSHLDEIEEAMDTCEPQLPQAQYRDGQGSEKCFFLIFVVLFALLPILFNKLILYLSQNIV